jgi:hypothetical protein
VTKPALTLVAYGFDAGGLPRAGRFDDADAVLAFKAATALGYRAGRVPRALAKRLPAGNVFAAGSGFIRRVSRAKLDELSATLNA